MNGQDLGSNTVRFIMSSIAASALFLTACGGGGSGGGQDPDPVQLDLPIAYVKRSIPIDPNNMNAIVPDDITTPYAFNPGAALYIRDRASPTAQEINITDRAWPAGELYDVKDVEASYDGTKLLFAMRAPDDPNLNADEQAKWDIWEYDLPNDTLRRVIPSDSLAQRSHDVAPHYLPESGKIVFSSDRQQNNRSILLLEGKSQFGGLHEGNLNGDEPAFVLHTMDDDGSNIDQITYNQSHDLQPTVLDDGRILFLRWDRYGNNNMSLYTINPDGSNQQIYYGFHSQNTGTNAVQAVFAQPRQTPNGEILVNLRTRTDARFGGDMVLIDGANYIDINQATTANAGATAPGQVSASNLAVNIDATISPHGYFNSAYPFFDNTDRFLVSWNQCRLVDPNDPDPANPTTFLPCTDANLLIPNIVEAEPLFGIWIYDPVGGTQLPIILPEDGLIYSEAVAMEPRAIPSVFIPPAADVGLVGEKVGVVHIRSVYDLDGVDTTANGIATMADPNQTAWSARPSRFIRIVKAVSIPDDDLYDFNNDAFGIGGSGQSMREILGYVPIEPDGSVKFKVPADVAFTISILNQDGARTSPRHQNWMQVRAGEELECNGCHTANSQLPHGRMDAQAASANPGATTIGPFPNAQPNLSAEMGETMAETYARINGPRTPSVDLVFDDAWSVPLDTAAAINYSYNDLDASFRIPTLAGCVANWAADCRITIHYPTHIQQIWDLPRPVVINAVPQMQPCSYCHDIADNVDDTTLAEPLGHLDLRNVAANPNESIIHLESFRELLRNDVQRQVVGGVLTPITVPRVDNNGNPVFQTDAMGNLILDGMGNPIQILDTITVPRSMSPAGAINSPRFFARFRTGSGNATHEGLLTPAEIKLISEWLDIGAQYYNDPFQAPVN